MSRDADESSDAVVATDGNSDPNRSDVGSDTETHVDAGADTSTPDVGSDALSDSALLRDATRDAPAGEDTMSMFDSGSDTTMDGGVCLSVADWLALIMLGVNDCPPKGCYPVCDAGWDIYCDENDSCQLR